MVSRVQSSICYIACIITADKRATTICPLPPDTSSPIIAMAMETRRWRQIKECWTHCTSVGAAPVSVSGRLPQLRPRLRVEGSLARSSNSKEGSAGTMILETTTTMMKRLMPTMRGWEV